MFYMQQKVTSILMVNQNNYEFRLLRFGALFIIPRHQVHSTPSLTWSVCWWRSLHCIMNLFCRSTKLLTISFV